MDNSPDRSFLFRPFPLRWNVTANFTGSAFQAVVNIALVPVYLRYLGVEAYGLIGLFASVQAVLSLFDIGLSTTLNRELARLSALENVGQQMRDTLRTLEATYWVLALLVGVGGIAISPFLALYWVNPQELSTGVIQTSFALMGVSFVAQFSLGLYSAGLTGLHRQVQLNVINVLGTAIRAAGAVLVLVLASQKVVSFFAWQAIAYVAQTATVAGTLWLMLPKGDRRPKFQRELIRESWHFAAGVTGISMLALALTQVDKIILSRMLSLRDFGYYALANLVVLNVFGLIMSASIAFYPKFSALISANDEHLLSDVYHRGSQLMSALIFPALAILVFFSYRLLIVWTGNGEVADNTYLLVSLLAIGSAMNGLLRLPFYLQLAYGWTRLAFIWNLTAVIIIIPLVILLTSKYGPLGACIAWITLNAGGLVVAVPLMHRRLISHEMASWYLKDLGIPLIVCVALALVAWAVLPVTGSRIGDLLAIGGVSILVLAAAALAAPQLRKWTIGVISNRFAPK